MSSGAARDDVWITVMTSTANARTRETRPLADGLPEWRLAGLPVATGLEETG
jgi:hypothetical protein